MKTISNTLFNKEIYFEILWLLKRGMSRIYVFKDVKVLKKLREEMVLGRAMRLMSSYSQSFQKTVLEC